MRKMSKSGESSLLKKSLEQTLKRMKIKEFGVKITEDPTTILITVPPNELGRVFEKLSPRLLGAVFCFEVKAIGFKYKAPKKRRKQNTEVYDD